MRRLLRVLLEDRSTWYAVRSNQPQATRDIQSDPHYAPWRELALGRGYRSSLALPLPDTDDEVFATPTSTPLSLKPSTWKK